MIAVLALLAAGSRQTLDLNAGWEFSVVPAVPSVWSGPDAVPTAAWKVAAVSSQETANESAEAARAFDGRPDTFWHTKWSGTPAPFPHSITIDLGAPTETVGIRLLPRQTGAQNGRPSRFAAFLDGEKVVDTAVPDSSGVYEVRFAPKRARTLRLEFPSGHRPDPFLVLAEIGLIRATRQGTDWASQYAVANVEAGDARFDLRGAALEKASRLERQGLRRWLPATLPHAAMPRPLNDSRIWQGVVYYRRRIPTPPPGRRTELTLQGMQSVDVWLNGRPIGSRRGGYLPFRVPIRTGGDLLVRVDNTDNPLIPPGKPQAQLDFMYGNGLIGDATLTSTDSLYITDPLEKHGGIRIEPPKLNPRWASTWVHTQVRNDGPRSRSFLLRQTVIDPQGRRVAMKVIPAVLGPGQDERFAQSLSIPKPRLWTPDSPTLYRVRTTLEEAGKDVDSLTTRIGLRTIEVSREKGFVLNGKPLRLVGTNRHQDYPWVGPALSKAAHRRDALLIKRSGHNIVRLAHYNQSAAFLDACDELGILTIPCIPGWQFINRDPRFSERVLRDIREMVRQDRNHPSVAFWETSLNETYPAAPLARTWHDAAKEEGANLTAGDEGKDAPWDVTYNGWREDLSRPSNSTRPGYIREYGDFEFGGATSSTRVRIAQGNEKLLESTWNYVWSFNKFRAAYPSTMGTGTWEMFDHNVPWDFAVSASGLADLMRREKPSFWFFESQATRKPYLRAVPDEHQKRLVVFTNAPSASLFAAGKLLQTARAVRGRETAYDPGKAFDGTNTANLPHPPIVFQNVPFRAGNLKVLGSNGALQHLPKPGKPTRLKVWVDDLGVSPTTNDLVFVRAAIVDANGTTVTSNSGPIRFEGAPFAGEPQTPPEMGIASVLIRTPLKEGTLKVKATLGPLNGTCLIKITR